MHLIFSGDALVPPRSGVGHYTYELIKELARSERIASIRVLLEEHALLEAEQALALSDGRLAHAAALADADMGLNPPPFLEKVIYKSVRLPILRRKLLPHEKAFQTLQRPVSAKLSQATPKWLVRRRLRIAAGNRSPLIFHATNYFANRYVGAPVLTVHDLSLFRMPDMHPAERVRLAGAGLRRGLAAGAHIIAVSEFTKREVSNFFAVDLSRIVVVPLAASREFAARAEPEVRAVLQSFGLTYGEYCLSVGTLEPRKNLSRLLDAWASLPQEMAEKSPLVLVGAAGWKNDEIETKLVRLQRRGIVKRLGFVPAKDLPHVVAGARISLYPSLYEGFGLPILESMASGVPVITSDRASMPEVSGGAAMCVDPEDATELAYAIRTLLEQAPLRADLSLRGLRRSRDFSWERCARETIDVYERAGV